MGLTLDYGAEYRRLHENGKHFRGRSIKSGLPDIIRLVKQTAPRRMLDYGCGKGLQYSEDMVHQQWGGCLPRLYDVGVPAFSKKPAGTFDAVICTDVMEHIDEQDVPAVLSDIFSYLPARDDDGESFAFFWISCRPAKNKRLPDGRNVHLCVKPAAWWNEKLDRFRRAGLIIEARYEG